MYKLVIHKNCKRDFTFKVTVQKRIAVTAERKVSTFGFLKLGSADFLPLMQLSLSFVSCTIHPPSTLKTKIKKNILVKA
jgi:hypothetical protein